MVKTGDNVCLEINLYIIQIDATGEKLSTFYLFQSISMAIQRGNAVCVMGCPKNRSSGLEGLFNFQVPEAEVLWLKNYLSIYT